MQVVSSHFDVTLQYISTPYRNNINVEGILCLCKTIRGKVYFFQWKSFEDVYKETVLAKPSGSGSIFVESPFETYLTELCGMAFGEGDTLHFYKEPNWNNHSRYQFAKGSPRSFVESLERMGLFRRTASKQHLFYTLRTAGLTKPDLYYYELGWGSLFWPPSDVSDEGASGSSDAESQITILRPEVQLEDPVGETFWNSYELENGQFFNPAPLKEAIFKGVRFAPDFLLYQ